MSRPNQFFKICFAFLLTCLSGQFLYALEVEDNNFYYLSIQAETPELRTKVANVVHIDQVIDGVVHVVVNKSDAIQLKKLMNDRVLDYHQLDQVVLERLHLVSPVSEKGISPKSSSNEVEFPRGDENFRTYNEVISDLKSLANKYPDRIEYFVMGKTFENRDIPGIRIHPVGKRKLAKDEFLPTLLLVASHHAREHLSTEVPMNIITQLLEMIGTDRSVTELFDTRQVILIPLLNPDGAIHDIIGRKYKMWRKNRRETNGNTHGVDLNRNYEVGFGGSGASASRSSDIYHGTAPFSEPETLAFKKFIESHPEITAMISFHTFSELILYPWSHKYGTVAGNDGSIFKTMADEMAKFNNYTPQPSNQLYLASGETCDWAYSKQGIFCFTFELSPASMWGGGFYPGQKMIPKATQDNFGAVRYLLEYTDSPRRVLTQTIQSPLL